MIEKQQAIEVLSRLKVKVYPLLFFMGALYGTPIFAQTGAVEVQKVESPRVGGYLGVVTSMFETTFEAPDSRILPLRSIGIPFGVNFWLHEKLAFSIEFVPILSIQAENFRTEGLLVHPGLIWNLSEKTSFSGRVAFESNGQFGFTPIIARSLYTGKYSSYSIAIPVPVRFGNQMPANMAVGLVLVWGF
ncbi:hypothetical protein RCC89_16210 [Cytophagaceae bacterium ABcell3]|nr:hypothetical protein RCC89_16210 [Cytophagaceae bacterium ABcell3]